MLQLPTTGPALPVTPKGPGGLRGAPDTGLDALLQGADGSMAGFSGELQAMLMQLSPQMLERLEELLAGGMTLPQAAKTLLAEQAGEGADDLFARMLSEGVAEGGDDVADAPRATRVLAENAAPGVAPPAPQRNQVLAELAQLLQPAAADAAPVRTAPGPAAGPLPQQVASSLLNMPVPQPVGGKGWDGAVADRVMWMVQGDQQFARLKLNPPNLGPLEIRVSINQDQQASVAFVSHHGAVRDALEAALPRLREMFDQQSLQLVRADVSDGGAQQGDRTGDPSAHRRSPATAWSAGGEGELDSSGGALPVTGGNGLIDLFA